MFNASSLERVNINTDGTFRFGNSAGDNLYWNGSTLVLTGRATIATSADSATTSNDLSCTDCVADTELNNTIDLGAGGVIIRSNNAANKVQISSSGLYGYNAASAQTFGIDASNGNAYFGPAGNQLSYVNGVLTVPGGVVTSGINADNITAGTITGRTLQTAASPNARIELSEGTKHAKWFTDATTVVASIGVENTADPTLANFEYRPTAGFTGTPYAMQVLLDVTNATVYPGYGLYSWAANTATAAKGLIAIKGFAQDTTSTTGSTTIYGVIGSASRTNSGISAIGGSFSATDIDIQIGDVEINGTGDILEVFNAASNTWRKIAYGISKISPAY